MMIACIQPDEGGNWREGDGEFAVGAGGHARSREGVHKLALRHTGGELDRALK